MSEKKTILFNDSFTTNKTRKRNSGNKPKKEKPKTVIKPNTLKKSLLEKIKKHQQKGLFQILFSRMSVVLYVFNLLPHY